MDELDTAPLKDVLDGLVDERGGKTKAKEVMNPLRWALTGQKVRLAPSPSAFSSLAQEIAS